MITHRLSTYPAYVGVPVREATGGSSYLTTYDPSSIEGRPGGLLFARGSPGGASTPACRASACGLIGVVTARVDC